MLYLEGWSSRSNLFYWCGLIKARLCRDITLDSLADVILLDIGTYQICIYMIIQVIAIFLQNIMFQLIWNEESWLRLTANFSRLSSSPSLSPFTLVSSAGTNINLCSSESVQLNFLSTYINQWVISVYNNQWYQYMVWSSAGAASIQSNFSKLSIFNIVINSQFTKVKINIGQTIK